MEEKCWSLWHVSGARGWMEDPSATFWDLPNKKEWHSCSTVLLSPRLDRQSGRIPWQLAWKVVERLRRINGTRTLCLMSPQGYPPEQPRKCPSCHSQAWSQIKRDQDNPCYPGIAGVVRPSHMLLEHFAQKCRIWNWPKVIKNIFYLAIFFFTASGEASQGARSWLL